MSERSSVARTTVSKAVDAGSNPAARAIWPGRLPAWHPPIDWTDGGPFFGGREYERPEDVPRERP